MNQGKIEEVKKILDNLIEGIVKVKPDDKYSSDVIRDYIAQQICQLFEPKPEINRKIKLTPEIVDKAFGKGAWEVLNKNLVYLGDLTESKPEYPPKLDYPPDGSGKELKPIESLLLTDERIAEHAIVCWEALEEHEKESFRLVARAQRDLTASIKDTFLEMLREIIQTLNNEKFELMCQLEVKDAECQQRVERIFREIDKVVRQAQTRWDKAQFGAVLLNKLQALKNQEGIKDD